MIMAAMMTVTAKMKLPKIGMEATIGSSMMIATRGLTVKPSTKTLGQVAMVVMPMTEIILMTTAVRVYNEEDCRCKLMLKLLVWMARMMTTYH